MQLRRSRQRAVLAGSIVVLTLLGATGCVGRYAAVHSSSPVFTSSAHGFSIQFPGKPAVHTFDNGDIDVTFHNGVSDYSAIAGNLENVPTAAERPTFYKDVIMKLNGTNGAKATDISATTIDGLPAEHALMIGGKVLQPWNYSIVICGPNIYQFNTYGVKSADVAAFLATLRITGKGSEGC